MITTPINEEEDKSKRSRRKRSEDIDEQISEEIPPEAEGGEVQRTAAEAIGDSWEHLF